MSEFEMVQLLSPTGERVHHGDYDVDFNDEEYRGLYRDLVMIRRFDAEATALQRQGELGLWAPLLGQEAAQIGAGRALAPQDMAFPTYREHGVAFCRGVDLVQVLSMFRCVDLGAWNPAEHNMHLYTIVIGDQTLHATGYAMGVAKDGAIGSASGTATMAFLGDGATSEGAVNEALVWAGVFEAPLVFFCQNNQYAISESTDHQTRVPLAGRAPGFGIPGIRVDGNDVLASYAVTKAALDRARMGEGPSFIEAFTYRMGAHTTSDDPTRYREGSEVDAWKAKDPISRYRAFLTNNGLADEDFFDQIDAEAEANAIAARTACLALPDPAPLSLFDNVYANGSPPLERQRDEFAAYLDSFADTEEAAK
ncbi:MAG: pyruvate dehydrogenase (acetyl-transferring) E1 component subunit alpha [Corynebacteriales bacterium]|nr:pyruvate dehydrogenase (acetyl-transferring) E1 component subunit alpha [Mycobacteriales bacterium]